MPTTPQTEFPPEAVKLILDEEGLDQPGKWPGGGSGITLGFGCDIGADPESLQFWNGLLPTAQLERLAYAQGKTGRAAAQIQTRFSDIKVTRAEAMAVFVETSLPREIAATKKTYPGIELLPPEVLGAMTSITYNRGTDLDRDESQGNRRLELREIADIIADYAKEPRDTDVTLQKIASQIQAMKRLWVGKGLNGLLTRRDKEALLVMSATV